MNGENEKFYLTKEGFEKIKEEYEALKKIRTSKAQAEAPNILESQDLNPDYVSFREDLDLLEKRLVDLENIIKKVALIKKPSSADAKFVDLGATVRVEVDGNKDEFTIVGTLEANPALGRISNESPVGKALVGHRLGEEVTVSSPIKTIYKIKSVKYS